MSLNQLYMEALIEERVIISKQGLDKKMTQQASDFMRLLLEKQMSNKIISFVNPDIFKPFKRVLIKDSTKFDLPESLSHSFPGFGRSASPTNACIQYEFDLKSPAIVDLDITPGRKNDSSDASDKTGNIESGNLIVRDLGYYSLSVLTAVEEANAFYLSKLCSKTKVYEFVYEDVYQELQMKKLYGTMKKNNTSQLEKEVFTGKEKMPVRLIVTLVPEQVKEERIRKREKENKKRGSKTTDEFKARAGLNLFITNVETEKLPSEAILQLYRLRWQIELVFKTWKSIFNLHTVHSMKVERFKCLLYSRLLFYMYLLGNGHAVPQQIV